MSCSSWHILTIGPVGQKGRDLYFMKQESSQHHFAFWPFLHYSREMQSPLKLLQLWMWKFICWYYVDSRKVENWEQIPNLTGLSSTAPNSSGWLSCSINRESSNSCSWKCVFQISIQTRQGSGSSGIWNPPNRIISQRLFLFAREGIDICYSWRK